VEFSNDGFSDVLQVETSGNSLDIYGMPSGTYQYRVQDEDGRYTYGEDIVAEQPAGPQELASDANGNMDLFFARASGKWKNSYMAQHQGVLNGWEGTGELTELSGRNKLADIFEGSSDANVLVMTDDENGDALFVDDVYTALGDQARLSQIDEIRAGLGDDIVDMTSQQFSYIGDGVTIYGGSGDDVIWANNGNNILFGDAGSDRIVGGTGNDVIIGGSGDDSMHGAGGNDTFTFGGNWGYDTVEQLDGGEVTLWFESGDESNWDASTLTYTDGTNYVQVIGVSAEDVTLKFGGDVSSLPAGCFEGAASEKIFEDYNKGMIA
jgi:Ca2+-binding RTX toxin-like protein